MLRSGLAINQNEGSSGSVGQIVELCWELWGSEGPESSRLLLVNGLGSPMVSYELGFIQQLVAAGFQVVRFDNRDVGKSSRMTGLRSASYVLADMAADAVAVLDAVGWETVHVVGQSMGGMISQQLAIDAPERLLSMTSLMSGTGEPGFGRPSKEALAALLTTQPSDREGWLDSRVRTEKLWASPDLWDPEWVRAKGELMFDYGVDPQGAARQYRAVVGSGSRDNDLAAITTPTLVMHGSADMLIGVDGGRHAAEVIAASRYVEIEGLGHDLPPKMWSRLVQEVADFALG